MSALFYISLVLFGLLSCQTNKFKVDHVSTIDSTLQAKASSILENKLSEINALSGQVIIMETQTGQIKALVGLERIDSAVYQPHQNVRQVEVQDQYTDDIFENADKIVWLPTYLSREDPDLEILSPDFLARKIDGNKIEFADLNEDLTAKITQLENESYLVLAMSAGTLDGWLRDNFAQN